MSARLPIETTLEVYSRCLCFGVHRAARALARRFDAAFAPLGISHGQYSLMMALNQKQPPRIGQLARLLAVDRTTLTANLKPLARRGLVEILPDPDDRRSRRIRLTPEGHALLLQAVPIWRSEHDRVDAGLKDQGRRLRAELSAMARAG
jgi:DNA-binding MarR family transcriptional regulator